MITREQLLEDDVSPIDFYFQFIAPGAKQKIDKYTEKSKSRKNESTSKDKRPETRDQLLRDEAVFNGGGYLTCFKLLSDCIDLDSFRRVNSITEINDWHKYMFVLSAYFKFYYPDIELLLDNPIPPRTS